ncbi:nuclear transport factor 2 family protein [Pseudoxanthomonas sp. PXM01]|jgi:hypothetical protein|uniref:nuclear transport factor 2 family protein n=1 Tax=Pseudoxanthomonas sp. PXM01 TaxID=2769295 RepID=UPI00177C9BDE|nr:nuclear transport factor 2 family protein [Pseudoxanthomonas sp. PXM01]MBD9467735.1 nuclear transport factor 2 family protein [Pseudoxanthomonas sp. PXM01]
MESTVRKLEEALRGAMLASDVAALDSLIADGLIFVGPSGDVFKKEDDLNLHRSGRQKLTKAEWRSVEVVMHGSSAVTLVNASLAGKFDGTEFSGDFQYCRFWVATAIGWRVVGGSVLAL